MYVGMIPLPDHDSSEGTKIHADVVPTRVNWLLRTADPQNTRRLVTGLRAVSFISSDSSGHDQFSSQNAIGNHWIGNIRQLSQ